MPDFRRLQQFGSDFSAFSPVERLVSAWRELRIRYFRFRLGHAREAATVYAWWRRLQAEINGRSREQVARMEARMGLQ